MSVTGWALAALSAPALWAQGLAGQGMRVGHLDTGVAAHLPALAGRVAAFRQFHRDGSTYEEKDPFDSGVHGTQTAALLCGGSVQGLPLGVAPQARLVSGLVIEGGHSLMRVLMGLAWMPAMGVRVLVLSLGVPAPNPLFKPMISCLRKQGILVVSPVGNAGAGRSYAPGNYDNVLSVGAVDASGRVASFSGSLNSHYGRVCHKPDLVAPGVDVATLSPQGQLVTVSGTSMAAAYVAGVALLLFQARPQSTVREVESALVQTARRLPPEQSHRSRAGLVDPLAALAALHALQGEPSAAVSPAPPGTGLEDGDSRFLDPRLLSRLQHTPAGAPVTALVVAAAGGCLERILAECGERSGQAPIHTQLFPAARTACITAPKPLIESLLHHEHILTASAPDTAMS